MVSGSETITKYDSSGPQISQILRLARLHDNVTSYTSTEIRCLIQIKKLVTF